MRIIRDNGVDWRGTPGVDRLGFTLREFNLHGAPVAAQPVDPVSWVIKGKGGKGKGRGRDPSDDDQPWTGPWAVPPVAVPPVIPPVVREPPRELYRSVADARQQNPVGLGYHTWAQ